MVRTFVTLLLLMAAATPALAQKYELGIGAGLQTSFNPDANVGLGAAVYGSFTRRIFHVPTVSLYAEVPVVAAFKINSQLPAQIRAGDYSSLFLAPGFKLKLAPEFPASPFFTVGTGWARYALQTTDGSPDQITNTGVVQFGGGVDWKIAPFLGFRTDVRDYYTGGLRLPPTGQQARQHNIVAAGALVFRF